MVRVTALQLVLSVSTLVGNVTNSVHIQHTVLNIACKDTD